MLKADLLSSQRLCKGNVALHSQGKRKLLHLQDHCKAFSQTHTQVQNPVFKWGGRKGGSRGLASRQVSSRGHDDLQTRCPLEHTSLSLSCLSTLIPSHFTLLLFTYHTCHLQVHVAFPPKHSNVSRQGDRGTDKDKGNTSDSVRGCDHHSVITVFTNIKMKTSYGYGGIKGPVYKTLCPLILWLYDAIKWTPTHSPSQST